MGQPKKRNEYNLRLQAYQNSLLGELISYLRNHENRDCFKEKVTAFIISYHHPFMLYNKGESQEKIEKSILETIIFLESQISLLRRFFTDKGFSVPTNYKIVAPESSTEMVEEESAVDPKAKEEIQNTQELFKL
jgi:hypothetical protein